MSLTPVPALFPDLIMTPRLRIDLFTAADTGFIIALLNSRGWLEGIGDRHVHTETEALAFLHRINNTPDFRYWSVRIKETGLPAGMISCIKRPDLDDFDLGFAFLPEYNGQGYALEAADQVLRALKQHPRFQRVLAFAMPSNNRSVHLLKKLGFVFESEHRSNGKPVHLYRHSPASD